MAKTQTVTSSNFDQDVLSADVPVLVDFWAEWCGPCRAVAPTLEQLAGEQQRYRVAKLNVDEHPDIARRYDVLSIPTMILFQGGSETARLVGAKSKREIASEVESRIS